MATRKTTTTRARKNAARATATDKTSAPARTVGARSAYAALATEHGVRPLVAREMFRDRIVKIDNGAHTWGSHNRVTPLHMHCVATVCARRGDDTRAAKLFGDMPRDFDPTAWRIDRAALSADLKSAGRAPRPRATPRGKRR